MGEEPFTVIGPDVIGQETTVPISLTLKLRRASDAIAKLVAVCDPNHQSGKLVRAFSYAAGSTDVVLSVFLKSELKITALSLRQRG